MPGVYLSYPFCAQKCTYCNFASGVFPRGLEERYLEALAREIRAHRWQWRPETVYLGGGTPGAMDPDVLRALLELVPGRPWVEATIEVAPGGVAESDAARVEIDNQRRASRRVSTRQTRVSAPLAEAWVGSGITRASLGVQSFVEKEIRRSGRKHTAQTVAEEIGILREAGIRQINIDLIAGLSGQTGSSWNESLDWIERLAPEHVSVYMLEVDEDSRLGKELLLGGVRYGAGDVPGEDDIAAFYETAVGRLEGMGLARYEISNFARPGCESRHNLKYWRLEPYVGFGADAHSFDGRVRGQNPETVADYLGGQAADAPQEAHLDDERFYVGLRLMSGIRPSREEWQRFEQPIRRFVDAGLLETADGALRLTARGVLLSNEVFQEFLTT